LETVVLEISFIHNEKKGTIEACYEENKSPIDSGFDIVKDLVPDINMCIGYPTVHAYLKDFEGNGFRKFFGWIQIITLEFYNLKESKYPDNVMSQVDVTPNMKENGIPFFSFGCPADLYDAPCNNFSDCFRLKWSADTFLVTMPSFLNGETITYLAGFRWGYEDSRSDNNHKVEIVPIETIDASDWSNHLTLLNRDFPKWNFV
jgi:hypothetical protein